jgi:hypothetical protein
MGLSNSSIRRLQKSFRNTMDKDIDTFMRQNAIKFESKHWCSTYLVLTNISGDFDENADNNFNLSDFRIEAYFTLVNKAIWKRVCCTRG